MVTTAKTIRKDSNLVSLVLCLVSCVLCLAQLTNTATAATYYVDNVNGNDTNPGTEAKPWKTMLRAMDANYFPSHSGQSPYDGYPFYTWAAGEPNVEPGDTVYFKNGNYGTFSEDTAFPWYYINNPNQTTPTSYHRTQWITYKAYSGHTPNLDNIYINNPYGGESYLKFEGFNVKGVDIANIHPVSINSTKYVEIKDCNVTQFPLPYTGIHAPYYLPDIYSISIKTNCQYVTVDGCRVHNAWHGIYTDLTSSDINIINNEVYRLGEDGITVMANNSLVQNNLIYDINAFRSPIVFQGDYNGSFVQGDSADLYNDSNFIAPGIVLCLRGAGVGQVMKLYMTGKSFFSGPPWVTRLLGNKIICGNGATVTNITYCDDDHCDGIVVGGASTGYTTQNVVIDRNKIIRNYPGDEGIELGVQCLKLDGPQHITISNNLLVACPGGVTPQDAILMGGGTTDCTFVNNTMFGCLDVRNLAPGPTLDINNMFNNIITYLSIDGDGACKPHIVNHGNNIFGNNPNGMGGPTYPFVVNGTELVNYNINTLFVNAANNDFNLAPNSVAINFGNPSYGPAADILGKSRVGAPDAGCYEYTGSQSSKSPPNADAGPDQTLMDSDQSGSEQVTLDGSGSNDPDGSIVKYEWFKDLNAPPIAAVVNPTVTLSVGQHTITLRVTDNDGLTDTDTVTVTIGLEPGLVEHLKFDEGSGTTANDSSGLGTAGRLVNGPTWTTQGEISFDGSDDAVEISTANLNAGGGTVALWAYPDAFSKSRHFLFGHILSGSNRIQVYCDASGSLCVGLGDNAGLSTNIQTLNAHEWYHIALVWNGTNYVVYVDGVQKATGTYSGLSGLQTYADIGNSGNSSGRTEGFDGLIDEVRLYDKPLAASEIADLALMFLPIGDKTVVEGEELRFSIRAKSDSIVELSDPNLPSLSSFASNVFSWTPDYDDAGTYEIEFTAPHDSGEDFEKVAVTVMDAQQAKPVGHWQFDELSDDIASDASTSNNTGYLRNGLAWGSGKINGALVFSVPNDAVEIQTTNFNPKMGTIAMWVYVERQTLSRHYLFGHTTESMANRIQLYLKYGNLCLGLGNSHETHTNIQQLQNQKWYHITLTWGPTTYRVYVDGLPEASGVYPGLTGLAGHADIGNNGASRDKALNGKIDDVRIYDCVLGAAEIAQLAVGN